MNFIKKAIAKIITFDAKVIVFLSSPWIMARFYVAWEYYQHDDVYRERLMVMGFKYAKDMFVNCKVTRNYCYKKALAKHPELKWRIRLFPWSIPEPDIFEIARNSGAI